jgi:DNA polymerase
MDKKPVSAPAMSIAPMPPGAMGGPVEAQRPSAPFSGIAIIGEAPGRDEIAKGHPFAGAAGRFLDQALADVGIDRASCLVANPFRYRPVNNRIGCFFASKTRAKAEGIEINERLPAYQSGYCIVPHDNDIRLLWRLLKEASPRAIVALGNTAIWALCLQTGVVKLAGQVLATKACSAPVIPTYHPAYLLRRHNAEDDAAFRAHFRLAMQRAGLKPREAA